MSDDFEYRCGYCGTPGDSGRCPTCGSGMDHEDRAIERGDKHLIKTWLQSRDRAWRIVEEMGDELRGIRLQGMRNRRKLQEDDKA